MMLDAGSLRHRVVLQRQVETQDQGSGAVVVSWQDVATLWSKIEPLSAREFFAAQAEASKVTTRITIRYRSDVTPKMRLYHAAKNAYYDIEGVLADKESGLEYLTLPCSDGLVYEQGDPSVVLPVNLAVPVITGGQSVGDLAQTSNGLWANDPVSFKYQWYVNDFPVSGADQSNWTIDAQIDDIVTVGIIAVNAAGESIEAFSEGFIVE